MKTLHQKLAWSALVALFALSELPSEAYFWIRVGVCSLLVSIVFVHHREISRCSVGALWILISLAIIFNPIFPLYLGRELWLVMDIAVAGTCGWIFAISSRSTENDTPKQPTVKSWETEAPRSVHEVSTLKLHERQTAYTNDGAERSDQFERRREDDNKFGAFNDDLTDDDGESGYNIFSYFGSNETVPQDKDFYIENFFEELSVFFFVAVSDGELDENEIEKIGYGLMMLSKGSGWHFDEVQSALTANRPNSINDIEHEKNFWSALHSIERNKPPKHVERVYKTAQALLKGQKLSSRQQELTKLFGEV